MIDLALHKQKKSLVKYVLPAGGVKNVVGK